MGVNMWSSWLTRRNVAISVLVLVVIASVTGLLMTGELGFAMLIGVGLFVAAIVSPRGDSQWWRVPILPAMSRRAESAIDSALSEQARTPSVQKDEAVVRMKRIASEFGVDEVVWCESPLALIRSLSTEYAHRVYDDNIAHGVGIGMNGPGGVPTFRLESHSRDDNPTTPSRSRAITMEEYARAVNRDERAAHGDSLVGCQRVAWNAAMAAELSFERVEDHGLRRTIKSSAKGAYDLTMKSGGGFSLMLGNFAEIFVGRAELPVRGEIVRRAVQRQTVSRRLGERRNRAEVAIFAAAQSGSIHASKWATEYLRLLWGLEDILIVESRFDRSTTAFLCAKPERQHFDDQGRAHNDDGPAVVYADGFEVHALHGVAVPKALVEGTLEVSDVLMETNSEVRRVAIERIGWEHFIDGGGFMLIDETDDPGNPGNSLRLYDLPVDLPDYGENRLLICTNGTVERDGTRRR